MPGARASRRGSVLIIVIWVCLGLVALALYFANSMTSELRAADNRVAQVEAEQAVAAGTRYAAYQLKQYAVGGLVPRIEEIRAEALPVGDATFWMIGRDNDQLPGREPFFGIVDGGSKLNLNSASRSMLEMLPGITPELVDAILNWRRRVGEDSEGGDAGATYGTLNPPRLNKGAPFESADEVRLVYGATLDLVFGEDTNRNGTLDPNEDDADASAPHDDQDGQLLAGIAEYVTTVTRQPATAADGSRRFDISALNTDQLRDRLRTFLAQKIDPTLANQVVGRLNPNATFGSVAEFMLAAQLAPEDYERIHTNFRARRTAGLINVNTAPEAVLACIPGIGPDNAGTIVAYRQQHPDLMTSFAWLPDILSSEQIRQAGPYITDQSYQFSADVAAVGRLGRGYARARTIFDMSNGTPRIIYHQDLTAFGWALGSSVRETSRTGRTAGL
ncbi:MAG: hypothetical protein V4773_22045 [Verrucomicrobiota bacterium]